MIQHRVPTAPLHDPVSRMIALLETYRDRIPSLSDELSRQRQLSKTLAEQHLRSEYALSAWREALAERWACEVEAQRAYCAVQQQLVGAIGAAHAQLLEPACSSAAHTPAGLLQEVRRLEASLDLLAPQTSGVSGCQARLVEVAQRLAAAIERTERREAERRAILAECKVSTHLLERAYERSRRLLARHAAADELLSE